MEHLETPRRYKRPQSFLRSRKAHTLDHREIAGLTEEQAITRFKEMRFVSNGGEPYCPACGCVAVYTCEPRWNRDRTISRPYWKCQRCEKQFTLTSGTAFSHRKMLFRDILWAIALFVQFPKGTASLQIFSFLRCDYRVARILTHKLREAMARDIADDVFGGEVEADTTEIGGYIRPKNARKERSKRDPAKIKKNPWRIPYQNEKKRYVTAIRARGPGGRIRTAVHDKEVDSAAFIAARVTLKTVLYTDQASAYQKFAWITDHRAINHSECFWTPEANTNVVENFFAMLKRSIRGVYHHIASPEYAHSYTEEMAWRLANNRTSNLDRFHRLLRTVGLPGRSKYRGWWQRGRKACATAS